MANQTPVAPKKSRRGCIGCAGCLIGIFILIAICGGTFFLGPSLLRSAGLVQPDAEELYSGAPDPVASQAVEEVLLDAGIEGASAIVIPTKGRNGQLAVISFDSSTKFRESGKEAAEETFMKTLSGLSEANAKGLKLERAVASYNDDKGDPLLALTAPQSAIESYSAGQMSRNEFLREVDADLSALFNPERIQSLASREQPDAGQVDAEFVAELAMEWAVEKNILNVDCPPPYDSDDCNVGVNPAELAQLRASQDPVLGFGLGVVGARNVDSEAATALGAAKVASDLARADTLADEGLKESNTEKIDQAIAMRPNDWSFRDRRAAFHLSQGNEDEAGRSFREAEELVEEHIREGGDCKSLQTNMLNNRQRALTRASEEQPGNRSLTDQISTTQQQLAAVENDQESSPCS
jgi:hypothetical protein